jgi:hypothetical protein
MIRDHVKARVEAVKAGHMPKVTLEEYETLRMNTDEWRAIAPILTDEALKQAITNTLKNCSNRSGTYEDALQNVYVPLLMERVFGSSAEEDDIKEPARTYTCSEMWDICLENPNARFAASYLRGLQTGYLLRAGTLPNTKKFCIMNEVGNHPFMDFRNDYDFYKVTRLPDAPSSVEEPTRTYSTIEMWDICRANPKARFLTILENREHVLKGGQHPKTFEYCVNYPDRTGFFMGARIDYDGCTITRLPDAD